MLINEAPLTVQPSLAVAIGLNQAIIVQQIHYWMDPAKNQGLVDENGLRWIYNSYAEWQKQFPFWSVDTIKRAVLDLEQKGLLVSTDRFNRDNRDRTKWYRIDHNALDALESGRADLHDGKGNLPSSMSDANCPAHQCNLPPSSIEQRLPTETTAETTLDADAPKPVSRKSSPKISRSATEIPDDFALTRDMHSWAIGEGMDSLKALQVFDQFCDHHRAKGSKFKDWTAAFRTWVRNEVKWSAEREKPRKTQQQTARQDAIDYLDSFIYGSAQHD